MSEHPGGIDLEAHGLAHMAKHARTATFAPNWRAVLAADASLGVVLAVIGVLLVVYVGWYGWPLIVLGVIYVLLVGRRFLQWRWLRTQVGL